MPVQTEHCCLCRVLPSVPKGLRNSCWSGWVTLKLDTLYHTPPLPSACECLGSLALSNDTSSLYSPLSPFCRGSRFKTGGETPRAGELLWAGQHVWWHRCEGGQLSAQHPRPERCVRCVQLSLTVLLYHSVVSTHFAACALFIHHFSHKITSCARSGIFKAVILCSLHGRNKKGSRDVNALG